MQNYHSHKSFSNINTSFKDSAMQYADYVNRALELGQQVVTSVDHGTQGNYRRLWQACQAAGLKFVYGVEAYWVKDRHEQDKTNAHIILLAKSNEGILQLNRMLSKANRDGYYYVPRVDPELIKELDPEHVFCTTACVAFWGKVDRETQEVRWHYGGDENDQQEIMPLFDVISGHFKDSFALEVQAHNTNWQKTINKLCQRLHYERRIPLIVGLDSHYIYPHQKQERMWLREESGTKVTQDDYEFDERVYEDYPDEATVIERFRQQGVLTEQEIRDAIDMTDTLLFFDDITFDTSRKLPTIYPNLTQEERNAKYLNLVKEAWERYKVNVPQERWAEYEKSFMEDEVNMVLSSNMSDYFLLDHELVKRGVEMGGRITPTGRGSSGSWFTNTLLGFSTLDRFAVPVSLYPARFCTEERLKTSCPDLDMNLDDPSIFAKAQKELMQSAGGDAYPMIAYGTLKLKSAFKLYARSQGLPAETANEVSKQIAQYELALKEAESDEDRDSIRIEDYVEPKYADYIRASEPYRGIVVSKSQAPCAYLVYNGDIASEIGIMRVNAKGGKQVVYCTVCDGYTAEDFGFVKNDLLAVRTISQSAEAYRRAGYANVPSSRELIELTKNDKATWDIFANGFTQGVNQCSGPGTTDKIMQYKPRSLQDLAAFVAAVRPGFKSMVGMFIARDKFEYGIPAFDALLKNDSSGSSWLLYQEDIMKCLALAGFSMEETYPIIKAISKKKAKVIEGAKPRFTKGFTKYIGESGDTSDEAEHVWQIIIDSASYLFNSSHSVAVALDALYGAYAKAHFPYEYYSALLDDCAELGHKDKAALIKTEMKRAFGIDVALPRFGQDNRKLLIDKERHRIVDALPSIKHISATVANALYEMKDERFENFVDVLVRMDEHRAFNTRTIEILIRIGYFEQFGEAGTLLDIFRAFTEGDIHYAKTYADATKQKRLAALHAYEQEKLAAPRLIPPYEQLAFETSCLGNPVTRFEKEPKLYSVLDIRERRNAWVLTVYGAKTGKTGEVKVKKATYSEHPLKAGEVFKVLDFERKPAMTFVNGERKYLDRNDIWLRRYEPIPVAIKI